MRFLDSCGAQDSDKRNALYLQYTLTDRPTRQTFGRGLHYMPRPFAVVSVSQPQGRGPVPGPGINYTGPREILLQLITNLNVILYLSTCHTVHTSVVILYDYAVINY